MAKQTKKKFEAEAFRARIMALRGLWDTDWSDWEADWLDSQARRPAGYIQSDKERVILNQLVASAKGFEGYNGFTVQELFAMANRYLKDLDEASEEFIIALSARLPKVLRVRQINQLARICRINEDIGVDEAVEEVLREVRGQDDGSEEWSKVA